VVSQAFTGLVSAASVDVLWTLVTGCIETAAIAAVAARPAVTGT
jgi:hypothetical protein